MVGDLVHRQAKAGVDQLRLNALGVELLDPRLRLIGRLDDVGPTALEAEVVFGIVNIGAGREQADAAARALRTFADEVVALVVVDDARRTVAELLVDAIDPEVGRLDDMRDPPTPV